MTRKKIRTGNTKEKEKRSQWYYSTRIRQEGQERGKREDRNERSKKQKAWMGRKNRNKGNKEKELTR